MTFVPVFLWYDDEKDDYDDDDDDDDELSYFQ